MKISQFKSALQLAKPETNPVFLQTSGLNVAAHYHITEIGLVLKNYVDCGGIVRQERKATMQIWLANDTDHRLSTQDFGFQFTSKKTTCLAPGHCGIPEELLPQEMQVKTSCSPGSGCC
jgi:hypothetical protein